MEKDKKLKIVSLEVLADIVPALKKEGKKIIHCHGVFDLLHPGHIQHFKEAKACGDILIVTVTADAHVNKGPHRPAFTHDLRAEVLAALEMIDYVAISHGPTAVEVIKLLKPHLYIKGSEYEETEKDITGQILLEEEAIRSVGGDIRHTHGATFSSSTLLNRHFPMFPTEANDYLHHFRKQHSADAVLQSLDHLRSLRVLVVGEAILDEYVYCDAIGKSSKDPILTLRHLDREMFAGGALAIANHLSDFCNNVALLTYLGETNSQEEFVRKHLKSNIRPTFITKSGSPTIVKRRFVDKYLLSKLLEIYEINDDYLNDEEDKLFSDTLQKRLSEVDLVIVADFGHGLITPKTVEILCQKAPFLCVNTQINAGNIGFHTISKYRRADYVCIHEGEIRLDHRNRNGDLKEMVTDLSSRLGCKTIMVTRGKYGTLLYQHEKGFLQCPSFATKVIDRIGAGDSVFALTSVCVAQKTPPDITNFIGNLVGAQAVTVVGNSSSINGAQLKKSIESILK